MKVIMGKTDISHSFQQTTKCNSLTMGNKITKLEKLPCVNQDVVVLEEYCVTVKEIQNVETDWVAFHKQNARSKTSTESSARMLQSSIRPHEQDPTKRHNNRSIEDI